MRAECGALRLGLISNYWLKRLPSPPPSRPLLLLLLPRTTPLPKPILGRDGKNCSIANTACDAWCEVRSKRGCSDGKNGKDGKHGCWWEWETSVRRSVTPTAVVMEYMPPLYGVVTCCGWRTFRPEEYVSADRTDVCYTVGGGVTLWVMPITGPGCTCQYSSTMAGSWAGRRVRLSSLLISPTDVDL